MLALFALADSARGAAGQPLPVLGRVADFALVDQSGSSVSRATFAGEPWVANFIFTRCPSQCPLLTKHMRMVQTLARRDGETLRLVSFSVDPDHDQPAVLAAYADAHGAEQTTWKFLTGSDASIEAVVRSFSVALDGEADPSKSNFGIMHSGQLVLVDAEGRIRGYYPSSDEGVEERIVGDLKRLEASEARVAEQR